MSRIDELIAEHCPGGVPFVPLGELARIRNGKDYKSFGNGDVPVYGTGGVMTHVDTAAHSGPSVLIPRKGSLDKLYYVDRPFWTVDTIFYTEIGNRLVPKFFYYFLLTRHLEEMNQAGGIPSLTQSVLNQLRIPVPPLEVQREIVRILDHFTEFEAELEAELEARRRQYAYYSDSLLTLQASAELQWATLGEIADFKYGFTASAADTGEYRFLRITDIDPAGKLRQGSAKYVASSAAAREYTVSRGDLLMARTGATFGKTMLVESEEPAIYASFLIRIRPFGEHLLPSYYWHFAQSNLYWAQANAMVSTGGQPQFNANSLKLVRVPVPPLEEQERIVAILDKFDALVNDLIVGLPAELAARRKQYEHYRDRLLTFKELVA